MFWEAVIRAVAPMSVNPEIPLPERQRANLSHFLDLAERRDPAHTIYREGRRVNSAAFQGFLQETRTALAAATAFNNLGTADPGPLALIALEGWVAYADAVIEAWITRETVSRGEVERLLSATLADVVARAGGA